MAPVLYPSLHERRPGGSLSLNGYMMLLIAAILLPMLTLVSIIAFDYGRAAQRTIEAQRLDVAGNLEILIDREIDRTVGFLDGISSAPGLRANRPEIVDRLTALAKERGFASISVYDLDGSSLAPAPASAPGGPPRLSAAMLGLAEIRAGRRHHVTNLIADAGPRPGLYFVSVPIKVDGEIVGMLSGGLPPSRLQRLIAEAGLQPLWSASIVDRNGILLARSAQAEIYVGVEAQKPMAEVARGSATAGLFDEINRSGIAVKNAYERSSTSGWVAGVGVPTEVVEAPLRETALLMAVIGIVLTLASLLAAFLVSSHLTRAVRRLGLAAVAIASGDNVPMPESNIAELSDASRSIGVTGARARHSRRSGTVTTLKRP
jgi:hypothetical protein